MSFTNHLLSFLIAFILADFWNGLVHIYMDNNEKYEGFWGPFIASFHLHHRTPKYKEKPVPLVYFDESGSKIWMAPVEILVIAFLFKLSLFTAFTFLYFFILSSFAELSHYFFHTVDGKLIKFMQKINFILNKKHHAKHHMNDNINYAF
jgi:sterol desaturase/sphingolipid hydroxylase (fatty acid hydroxylase superfamily)